MARKKKATAPEAVEEIKEEAAEAAETVEETAEKAEEVVEEAAEKAEEAVEEAAEAAKEKAEKKDKKSEAKAKAAEAAETAKAKAAEASEAAKIKAAEASADAKETAEKIKKKWNEAKDRTAEYDEEDIIENKYFSLLGYFGLLILLPLIFAPHSKFAKFHANQALVLFVVRLTYVLFTGCIVAITALSSTGFAIFLGLIFALCFIVLFVIWVQGIANAADGKARELPFIGTWELLDLD